MPVTKRIASRGLTALACTVLLSTALAACGESGEEAVSGECLPGSVRVAASTELTGAAAFAGISAKEGIELAVDHVNERGLLEDAELEVDFSDTAGEVQTAASQATQAMKNEDYVAAIGPISSSTAVAFAPVVDRGGLPTVFAGAGTEGVVIGENTFRITPPMETYYPKIADLLESSGTKRMAIIYNNDWPTLAEIAEHTLPEMAEELGFEIVSTSAVPLNQPNMTPAVTRSMKADPDMVAALLVGAQNPTTMTNLRQAGYDGPVIGNPGAGGGNLDPAAESGAGMVWPSDFHYEMTIPAAQEFVASYQEKYGEKPLPYAAGAYDGVMWLAEAVKRGCADREGIRDGLAEIANEGLSGVRGEVSFEGNDARLDGVLVEWNGTSDTMISD